jgi:predicted DCC family thiol-disulfide oxidoreductase YuxK
MLYDGDCRLCRWAARIVDRLDRHEQVALLSLGEEEAPPLLASVPRAEHDQRWWLVRRDGTVVPGDGGGGIELLTELRLTRPLGRALQALRATRLVGGLNRRVSRSRSRVGRFVPEGPAPRRYP